MTRKGLNINLPISLAGDPRFNALSDKAVRALISLHMWCMGSDSDGVIPRAYIEDKELSKSLRGVCPQTIKALIKYDFARWDEQGDTLRVEWSWQTTAAEREKQRQHNRDRQQKFRSSQNSRKFDDSVFSVSENDSAQSQGEVEGVTRYGSVSNATVYQMRSGQVQMRSGTDQAEEQAEEEEEAEEQDNQSVPLEPVEEWPDVSQAGAVGTSPQPAWDEPRPEPEIRACGSTDCKGTVVLDASGVWVCDRCGTQYENCSRCGGALITGRERAQGRCMSCR